MYQIKEKLFNRYDGEPITIEEVLKDTETNEVYGYGIVFHEKTGRKIHSNVPPWVIDEIFTRYGGFTVKEDEEMEELISQMNKVMKSTSESALVIGEAMKSVLNKLNEGGK